MSISKIAMLTFGMVVLASSVLISNHAYAGNNFNEIINGPVGGLPVPIDQSELFGELVQYYALWLIPAISAIGIGAFLFKRKF